MLKRIIKTFLVLFLVCVLTQVGAENISGPVKFTILHTSDIHAHLLPFDSDLGAGIGGYARIKAYRDDIVKQGKEVIFLSSGDFCQGTFFYRFFQGIPDIQFMNSTGYKAMSLGNHEFDKGQDVLADAVSRAKFPILAANLVFKKRVQKLQERVKPYGIFSVKNDGNTAKIAVIGLIPEEFSHIVQPLFIKDIEVISAVEAIEKYLPEIKAKKPDMILVLSHLGWNKSLEIFEGFSEIDGVLSGHTHLLNNPIVLLGPRGHRFISEPMCFGQYVTRYDIEYNPSAVRKVKVLAAANVPMEAKLRQDRRMASAISKLWKQVEGKVNVQIGTASLELDAERDHVRNYETNLGNLVCDSFAQFLKTDMCFMNGGGIRSSIAEGPITIGDCLNVLPFDNYLQKIDMTGASIKKLFNQLAELIPSTGGFGGFLQVSKGVSVDYTKNPVEVLFRNKPLDDNQVYTVAVNDFLSSGGNGLTAFTEATNVLSTGVLCSDAFIQYIEKIKIASPEIEGRIKARMPTRARRHRLPNAALVKVKNTFD